MRAHSFGLRTVSFVRQRLEQVRVDRGMTTCYLDLYGQPNHEGWIRTQARIRAMDRQVRARGGRFLVATWPVLTNLKGQYPFRRLHETIGRFCHSAGIAWLDFLPTLRAHSSSVLWVHPLDAHPNEVAHRLVADQLAPAVRHLLEDGPPDVAGQVPEHGRTVGPAP